MKKKTCNDCLFFKTLGSSYTRVCFLYKNNNSSVSLACREYKNERQNIKQGKDTINK